MPLNQFKIRCRGIILDQDRLLVVKHSVNDKHYVLPGGHLEFGENIKECMLREIVEELGVEPILGNILYIHNYNAKDGQSNNIYYTEFLFEITNGKDFVDCDKLNRTHAFELTEIRWISTQENIDILPKQISIDFRNDKLISNTTRFIN